jgi:hypothetical protein
MQQKVTKIRANLEFGTKNYITQNELSIFKAQTKYANTVNKLGLSCAKLRLKLASLRRVS